MDVTLVKKFPHRGIRAFARAQNFQFSLKPQDPLVFRSQFVEQECSLAAEAKYPASRLYEDYRHCCQILGRKPQFNSAFKKALDKLVNVYQSRSSSGMQWHGIEPLMRF